tara:strand:- start:1438 stop:1722 length:285 start_codon:yes stop_codon:yes gene_type:complete
MIKKIIFFSTFLTLFSAELYSQGCSMCRGIVESDANSGGTGISSSINSGIVYLFTSTYILILIGASFWYYRSKKHIKEIEDKNRIKRRVASLID